jgi:hypothetical protein
VTMMSRLDLTAAFYGYHVDSYQNLAVAPCKTTAHGNCSGEETTGSVDAVYHYTKRFDGYIGAMYSSVANGLASGFLNKSTINPTVGVRFKF